MIRSFPIVLRPLSAALVALALSACSLTPPASTPAPTPALDAETIARDSLGYLVQAVADGPAGGSVAAAKRPDGRFIPASTAKLASALAARAALPADHRFATRLCADARPDASGRLDGDLRLVGGGDPTLGIDDLLALAEAARAAGLRRVAGRFLLDPGPQPPLPAIAAGQPPDAAYNPRLSGLMVAEGAHRLEWRADGRAWFVPDHPSERPAARRLAALEDAPEGERWLPVLDPTRAAGRLFRQMAAGAGLTLPEPESAPAPSDPCPVELARVESAPRDAVLAEMLATSSNPMAELVGLAAARARGETPAGLRAAAAGTAQWLRAALPEADWRGLVLPNHSGLGADARISPRQMAALLSYAYNSEQGGRAFPALLPLAGWSGGLARRLDQPETAVRIWAKTGVMHYGVGLAGYLYARGGQVYAFAFFATDRQRREAYNRVALDPSEAEQTAARLWDAAARAAIETRLIEIARRL